MSTNFSTIFPTLSASNTTSDVLGVKKNAASVCAQVVKDTRLYHGHGWVVPLALFMALFIVMAIVGNIMVVMTVVRHRGMRTRTNMFIVNLAVADILVAVLDMPISLYTIIAGDWKFGKVMCQLNGFTMALFLICSIHTLMYISIHKYMSITRPFSRVMTPRRIKIMIAATWIWATVCAFSPIIGWNKIIYKKGASQCGPDIPCTPGAKMHSLFISTSNYIIPLSVMSFCYYKIFREIHLHMNRVRETSNINQENSVAQQKKVSITLLFVLACFVMCWTPFIMYSTSLAFMKDKSKMPFVMNPLAYWCGYFNSACNPVIYAFRSPSFRKGYMEIMCGKSDIVHSGVHSLSFRSKSSRGSIKTSTSNVRSSSQKRQDPSRQKPKRMLSQTSWISLPIIPYLMRSVSSPKGNQNKDSDCHSIGSNDSAHVSYCCFQCRKKHEHQYKVPPDGTTSHPLDDQDIHHLQNDSHDINTQDEDGQTLEHPTSDVKPEDITEISDDPIENQSDTLKNDSQIIFTDPGDEIEVISSTVVV